MAFDAQLFLINRPDVDSGNDGDGSGTNEATGAGRVIDVDEGAHMAVVMHLAEPGATVAGDSDTLDVICQVSPNNSTWGPVFTFRQFLGSEINSIDESSGSVGITKAGLVTIPRAASGQSGKVKCRLNIVVSATEHFSIEAYLTDPANVREEWYDNAQVNA